jgi:hypothetical protein
MTTFRNYTNGIYDTQIKCVLARYQREQAVNNAITSLKAANKATREAKEKELIEEYRNAENEAWNEYVIASQTAYILYTTAYQSAEGTYKSAKQNADDEYISTVTVGWNTYNNKVNNLDALFEAAVEQAGNSGFNPATFFNNGTSGNQGNVVLVTNKKQPQLPQPAVIPPNDPSVPDFLKPPTVNQLSGLTGTGINLEDLTMEEEMYSWHNTPESQYKLHLLLNSELKKELEKIQETNRMMSEQYKQIEKSKAEILKNIPDVYRVSWNIITIDGFAKPAEFFIVSTTKPTQEEIVKRITRNSFGLVPVLSHNGIYNVNKMTFTHNELKILTMVKKQENIERLARVLYIARNNPNLKLNPFVKKGWLSLSLGPDQCHRWVLGTRDAIVACGKEYYNNDEYIIKYVTWNINKEGYLDHGGLVIDFYNTGKKGYIDNLLNPYTDAQAMWYGTSDNISEHDISVRLEHPFWVYTNIGVYPLLVKEYISKIFNW